MPENPSVLAELSAPPPELRDPHLCALLMYIDGFNGELTEDTHAERLASLADLAHRILNTGPRASAFAGVAGRPSVSDVIQMHRRSSEERGDQDADTLVLICDDADEGEPITVRPQHVRDVLYRLIEDATVVGAAIMYELLTATQFHLNVEFQQLDRPKGGL